MKRKKRDRVDRAFLHGFKAGARGHDMGDCPFFEKEAHGSWLGGWREGRSSYLTGYLIYPEYISLAHSHR